MNREEEKFSVQCYSPFPNTHLTNQWSPELTLQVTALVPQIRTGTEKFFSSIKHEMGGATNSKASQPWQDHLLHLTKRLPQWKPDVHSFFFLLGQKTGVGQEENTVWVWQNVHDKHSYIFGSTETDCSQPVRMSIFSSYSRESPSPSIVGSHLLFPLGTLSLEIPVRGIPRKKQCDLDRAVAKQHY